MYILHIFFVTSSIYGHVGCFFILAIVNKGIINIRVHVSFQMNIFKIFLYAYPRVESLGHMVALFLVF